MKRSSSRLSVFGLLGMLVCLGTVRQASAQNLFAVANGNTVTGNSPLQPGFVITDLFGTTLSAFEPGNAIYLDGQPGGTAHFVSFSTAVLSHIFTVNVYASGDIGSGCDDYRDFETFNLYAKDPMTGIYNLALTFSPGHPEAAGGNLVFHVDLATPITAQDFRAEFTQHIASCIPGGGTDQGGPRILELEGYGVAAVPEPGAMALLAGCGLPLLRLVFRRLCPHRS